jgi:uncharacterized protein
MPAILGALGDRRFHVMAKPAGSTCNLDCTYCFYLSKANLPKGPGPGRMSDETLDLFVRQYISGVTADEVVFTWQGGEPTLRGIDFYRKVVELQKKYAKPGQRVENDLQTNGTLLNNEWCSFLKENRFLVGLSIDGPRELHDRYRILKNKQPTFDRVFQAAQRLADHGVPFNTLTCVNRVNAKKPREVYRFLRDELKSTRMQFLPVVEYTGFQTTAPYVWDPAAHPRAGSPEARPGHPKSVVTDWSVDPDDWGEFLIWVFDEWRRKDVGKILVNHFETLVAQHRGEHSQMCVYSEFCGKGVALEHDGTVYACDHFVYPEYRTGHIKDRPLAEMVFSPTQVKFGHAKNELLPHECRRCEFLSDCWGECPKNRILRTKDDEPGLNYLCHGLKKYFKHALPHVEKIAARLPRATH